MNIIVPKFQQDWFKSCSVVHGTNIPYIPYINAQNEMISKCDVRHQVEKKNETSIMSAV